MKTYYAVPKYFAEKHFDVRYLIVIPPEISYRFEYTTIGGLADALGIKSYDSALPQSWVDEFQKLTGFNPVGNFVWDYSTNRFGEPRPITIEGQVAYGIFKHLREE